MQRRLVTSQVLTMSTAIIMLGLVAEGLRPARAANHYEYRPWAHTQTQALTHLGYASRELWAWNVPAPGVQGPACDLPSRNDERINN
jgi:hypothetical protein